MLHAVLDNHARLMPTGGDDIVEAGWQASGALMDSLDALESCVAAPEDEGRRRRPWPQSTTWTWPSATSN